MSGKARLAELTNRMNQAPQQPAKASPATLSTAKHGEKGDYVKLTVTLPPAVYELVMTEVTRRKVAKEPEPVISAVLRDATLQYFSK
jgi:transcriptional regulator of met regulon